MDELPRVEMQLESDTMPTTAEEFVKIATWANTRPNILHNSTFSINGANKILRAFGKKFGRSVVLNAVVDFNNRKIEIPPLFGSGENQGVLLKVTGYNDTSSTYSFIVSEEESRLEGHITLSPTQSNPEIKTTYKFPSREMSKSLIYLAGYFDGILQNATSTLGIGDHPNLVGGMISRSGKPTSLSLSGEPNLPLTFQVVSMSSYMRGKIDNPWGRMTPMY